MTSPELPHRELQRARWTARLAVTVVMLLVAGMGGYALALPTATGLEESARLTRSCMIDSGAPIRAAATTGTDADTTQLDTRENVRIDCDTDAWMRACSSSTCTAAANDTKIRAGVPEYFAVDGDLVFMSFKSVTADGDCRVTKCH